MKTPRERAIEIAHDSVGGACLFSRALYEQILTDTGEMGKGTRKLVDAIERGIVADRRDIEKARAAS